jgi:hypothetical protein
LGTTDADDTVAASLREVIQTRRAARPVPIRSTAEWAEFLRRAREAPGEAELARRRAVGELMDRVRVKVGPDFKVVEEIRRIRNLSPQEPGDAA